MSEQRKRFSFWYKFKKLIKIPYRLFRCRNIFIIHGVYMVNRMYYGYKPNESDVVFFNKLLAVFGYINNVKLDEEQIDWLNSIIKEANEEYKKYYGLFSGE